MIPSIWPNLLLGLLMMSLFIRYVLWIEPWTATPAEKARMRGDMVYDAKNGEFVEVEG